MTVGYNLEFLGLHVEGESGVCKIKDIDGFART